MKLVAISEGNVIIKDSSGFYFGFVQSCPAVSAQGENIEEVNRKIKKIYDSFKKRN